MDITYFQSINNSYKSNSKQETDLYILNRQVNRHFADSIDYHVVARNGEPFELLIIKDTDANTTTKKIKSRPGQPFNLGDYIVWDNKHYLVFRLDPDDKTYNSGAMYLCNCCLRWQNQEGKIIERWAYVADYTKYSSGIYNNGTVIVGDNQYGCIIPTDSETIKLKRDMRFPVDLNGVGFPDIYRITNRKVIIDNYEHFNRGGTMTFILSLSELNKDKDKLVNIPNYEQPVWICDYKEAIQSNAGVDESYNGSAPSESSCNKIDGRSEIKIGSRNNYSLSTTNEILISHTLIGWKVECDFKEFITLSTPSSFNNSTLKISVSCKRKKELINKTFDLICTSNEEVLDRMTIKIIDMY